MINVCTNCGEYRADKLVDQASGLIYCPRCRFEQSYVFLPIFFGCGASSVGKSTICEMLVGRVENAIMVDGEILWRPELDQPETGYRAFFDTWLRLSKNIAQSGQSVVLFTAGGIPSNIEPSIETASPSENVI